MRKPRISARPLSALLGDIYAPLFAKQGFASRELVTRWREIAGVEVAAHSQPMKIQWPRTPEGQVAEPATLVLRVEGPMALEIQHASDAIVGRVNRFLGWNAVGRIALRQAPLSRAAERKKAARLDAGLIAQAEGDLPAIDDGDLKYALARLSVAIKRS